jgi:hypothetical protein
MPREGSLHSKPAILFFNHLVLKNIESKKIFTMVFEPILSPGQIRYDLELAFIL